MSQAQANWTDHSISEWHRLDSIATKYDQQLKVAWSRTVVLNKRDPELFRSVITDCVIETAVATAPVYGLVFNPSSPVWKRLIDNLTDRFMKVVDNEGAKSKVREILPGGIPLHDRATRLDVFGLDERSAVRLERMRQEGIAGQPLNNARLSMSVQRGNLVSLTEVNRIVNITIETLCMDNMKVSKADGELDIVWFYEDSVPSNVTSIKQLPKSAKKEIITRRDGIVCYVCLPLDGVQVRIGEMFETDLGFFQGPPFHPRCRCFLGVSL